MKKINLILFLSIMAFSSCITETQKKIMVVYSYHPGYEWQAEEDSGLMDVFGKYRFIVERFDLDTKRNTDPVWAEQITHEALMKIEEFQPDVILVCDDNACKMIATRFIGSETPVVFCGMNADPQEYGLPAANITGVVEREFWKESIAFIKELVPDIQKVVIMLDSSITARKSAGRISKLDLADSIDVFLTNDYNRWKGKVLGIQDSSYAIGMFVHATLTDSAHIGSVDQDEVLAWTLANSRLPEFGIMDFTVRNGALCGYCESGYGQGKLAAEMAVRILEGESPGEIPIASSPEGKRLINRERARQLGVVVKE